MRGRGGAGGAEREEGRGDVRKVAGGRAHRVLWCLCADRFLEDLDEGVFIQQTLDGVLGNETGKQLLVSPRLGHLGCSFLLLCARRSNPKRCALRPRRCSCTASCSWSSTCAFPVLCASAYSCPTTATGWPGNALFVLLHLGSLSTTARLCGALPSHRWCPQPHHLFKNLQLLGDGTGQHR